MSGVYFVRAGGNGSVKIGSLEGGDIYKRLSALQCGNHKPLYLRSFIVGNSFTESRSSKSYSSGRFEGGPDVRLYF